MTLKEVCTECDWSEDWSGGSAADDPAIEHAKETGHKVRTSPSSSGEGPDENVGEPDE